MLNFFREISDLNFPPGSYVVVGSGPLGMRGIREIHDIDLVVRPDLFKKCKDDATWMCVPWTLAKRDQVFLRRGVVELYLDVNCGDFNPTTDDLIGRADIVHGVPFASLEDIIKFKRAYNSPKHAADIQLVEKYLESRKVRGDENPTP